MRLIVRRRKVDRVRGVPRVAPTGRTTLDTPLGRRLVVQIRSGWLRGRRALAAVLLIGCGLLVYFVWFARSERPPTTAQIMAEESSRPAEIVIGPRVRVSTANGAVPHREAVAEA